MTDLTIEEVKSIIELVKDKSWLDYLALCAPSVVALGSIVLTGYMFKNQNKKNINESLVRDDIARLYQAADHFFEFSDAAGSFVSYKKYHYQRISRGSTIDEDFLEGLKLKSKLLANSFTNLHQATFMLSSLGFKELADKLEAHRERVVSLRSKTFAIEEKLTKGQVSTLQVAKMEKEFEREQKRLAQEKEKYIQDILDCKEKLLSFAKV